MLQRRETVGGIRLIEQIQHPLSSLLISLLPEVNYHTHLMLLFHLHHNYCGEDEERSRPRDMRPSITGQPHSPLLRTTKWFPHHHGALINILYPTLSLPNPPNHPLTCASRFLDWFHLFNDCCANDPLHAADSVIDIRTCQEWGLDGDLEREGRVFLKIGQDEVCVWMAQALVCVFPKQTRRLDAESKLETPPWRNFYTISEMKSDLCTSHHSLMVVSPAQVDISFMKCLCDRCGERHGYAEYTIWDFFPFFCNWFWGPKIML